MLKIFVYCLLKCSSAKASFYAETNTSFFLSPDECNPYGNCTKSLQNFIEACKSTITTGECDIQLGPGQFNMDVMARVSFVVNQTNRLTLHGAGPDSTILVFQDLTSMFSVLDSTEIVFANFSVDMTRVPFTLGQIVHTNSSGTVLLVSDTTMYPIDPATVTQYPYLYQVQATIGYDPSTNRFKNWDIYLPPSTVVTYFSTWTVFSGTSYYMALNVGDLGNVGDWILARHQVYEFNAFTFSGCSAVLVENVIVYATGGMALVGNECTDIEIRGGFTKRRSYPDGSIRAMSSSADGIHINNSVGGRIVIRDNLLEGQGDDGININTAFTQIANISSDRTQVQTTSSPAFWVGAIGQMFNGETMVRRSSPTPAVVALSGNTITFESTIPSDVQLYDLLINVNAISDTVLVEGNTFLNNRAHGALVKQPNALIQGNHFEGMTLQAVTTGVDGCYWMEGVPVWNWTFTSNTIVQSFAQQTQGPNPVLSIDAKVPVFENGVPNSTNCQSIFSNGVFIDVTITDNVITTDFQVLGISVRGTTGMALMNNMLNIPGNTSTFEIL